MAALAAAVACSSSACHRTPDNVPEVTARPARRAVPSETLRGARTWTTALAPNPRGGWNFITQTYELDSPRPSEFVVLDLATGKQTITEGPPGIYTNSNYQVDEQLRAQNGRIFFPARDGYLAYYEPAEERVKLIRVLDDPESALIFRAVFGPDGMLYGGTQSAGRPTLFRLDPETLKVEVLGKVGTPRSTTTYAYYLVPDPPWVYVAVGQAPWELIAFHMETRSSRVLATRDAEGFMQFDVGADGVAARLVRGLRTSAQHTEVASLVDGRLLSSHRTRPPQRRPARDVRPRNAPLARRPELDLSQLRPAAGGVGIVRWRLGNDSWRTTRYVVRHTSPVEIESLVGLSDGTLLVGARQYHGFFRYDPEDGSLERLGELAVSGGPRATVEDRVYIAGYPNGTLYAFDASMPWALASAATPNPRHLGHFVEAGAHYPYFLIPGRDGRLYYAGRRERTGTGTGVGYYEPASGRFAGHHRGLADLDPRGLLVLDQPLRVVLSGQVRAQGATAGDAPLVLFDRDLTELERFVVRPGLSDSGELFESGDRDVVVGVTRTARAIYRYDLRHRRLAAWQALDGDIAAVAQRPSDGSIWLLVSGDLVRIDPRTLERVVVAPSVRGSGETTMILTWHRDALYIAAGGQVRPLVPPSSR